MPRTRRISASKGAYRLTVTDPYRTACAVVVVVALAGCGSAHQGSAADPFANKIELAWLKKLGHIHGTLGHCLAELRHQVGPPPTLRLQRGYRLYERACRAGERGSGTQELFNAAFDSVTLGIAQPLPNASGSFVYATASRAVSQIALRRVQAKCWSKPNWARLVREHLAVTGGEQQGPPPKVAGFYADHVVQLAPATCSSLEQMTRTSEPQKQSGAVLLDWSQGLVTVAHEAVHAAGVSSDAAAECFAIQWIPATAATFGMRRAVGVELAHAAWKVYPREPSNYRSSACHRGGRLDLNLHSTVWD